MNNIPKYDPLSVPHYQNPRKKDDPWWIYALVLTLVLIVGLSCWIVPSYFEARSFNRITGQSVTTWDAMWIELRVQSGPSTNEASK